VSRFAALFGHLLAATADERRSKSKAPEGHEAFRRSNCAFL